MKVVIFGPKNLPSTKVVDSGPGNLPGTKDVIHGQGYSFGTKAVIDGPGNLSEKKLFCLAGKLIQPSGVCFIY